MKEIIVDKTTKEFVSFVKGCEAKTDKDIKEFFKNLNTPTFDVNNGRRYFKIIRIGDQTSVHCFVDRTNGDVLKAASWKAPAKHARGNIFNKDNGLDCMSAYGAAYLR